MKAYINEVHENYGCPPILNNCDDVLEFLVKTYKHPYCDEVFFQGDLHVADGFIPDIRIGTVIIDSPKYERTIFIVGPEENGEFLLSIIIVSGTFDQMPGIVLPGYVREEIIATAKGEY